MKMGRYTTLDGWRRYLDEQIERPTAISRRDYEDLTPGEQYDYDEARAGWFKSGFNLHTDLYKDLSFDVESRLVGSDYRRTASDLVLVDGEPYIGKSTALKAVAREAERRYARRHPGYRDHGKVPVAYIEMTPKANDKTVAGTFLDFFQHPINDRAPQRILRQAAVELLIERDTRLVVVDEFQMLHLTGASGDDAIDTLKTIFNEAQVVPLVAGNRLRDLLKSKEAAQLSERAGRHETGTMQWDTDEGREEWSDLVYALGSELHLLDGSPVANLRRHEADLYAHTGGNLGKLRTLLGLIQSDFIVRRRRGENVDEVISGKTIATTAPRAAAIVEEEIKAQAGPTRAQRRKARAA